MKKGVSKPPKRDEQGKRYGQLVVVSYVGRTKRGMAQWLCKCDCGKSRIVVIGSLQSGATQSCGCGQSRNLIDDLTGRRFGLLTAVRCSSSKNGHARWLCVCDCGGKKVVAGCGLKRGSTTNCGCRHSRFKHGLTGSPEHVVWKGMIQRCHNPKNPHYADYGGRGIAVCKRWRTFTNFLADMGTRPSKRHQIDRINNGKGYAKSNCRWIVSRKNNRNRRDNRPLAYRGKTRCLAEWAELKGLRVATLWARLNKGWSVSRALTTKVRSH